MIVHALIKPNKKTNRAYWQNPDESDQDKRVLVIEVVAPPIENKANHQAIKVLADFFKVSPSSISIIHGLSNKHKTFFIKK